MIRVVMRGGSVVRVGKYLWRPIRSTESLSEEGQLLAEDHAGISRVALGRYLGVSICCTTQGSLVYKISTEPS